jgi:hypothetical protein
VTTTATRQPDAALALILTAAFMVVLEFSI